MIDTNILFAGGSPAAQGIGQGYELFRQEQQRAIENSAAATTAAQNAERLAMDRQQNQRLGTAFDYKLQELARARQQDHVLQSSRQVSSLLAQGDTNSAMTVLKKAMLDAQSTPELGGLADDYAQYGEMLAAGDVASVKNQADAVISAFTSNPAGNTIRSSEIYPDGTIITVTDSGPRVTSPTGQPLTGQAAADAILRANQYGVEIQTQREYGRKAGGYAAEGEMRPDIEAKVEAATGQAKIATDAVRESYVMIPKVTKSIANIDAAIDALNNGADTGAIAQYLPSITDASISLDNAMAAMGLDVISATTFGALSEGEMRFALISAIPPGLKEPAMKKYLEDKRLAQEKAREALQNAVMFLSQPNPDGTPRTVADWMRAQNAPVEPVPGSGAGNTPAPAAQPSPVQTAQPPTTTGADAFVRQRQQTSKPNESYEDRKRRLLGL